MALIDDLSSTLTVHQVAETRSKIDCPINDPENSYQNPNAWLGAESQPIEMLLLARINIGIRLSHT